MNGSLNACTLYPYKTVWNMHFNYFVVFIAFIYFKVPLDVLKVFKGDIKRVTREVAIQIPADQP